MLRGTIAIAGCAVLLGVVGCSGKKGTDGNGPATIPTLNLTDQLLIKASDTVRTYSYWDSASGEVGIQVPDSLLREYGSSARAQLIHGMTECINPWIDVYDSREELWMSLPPPQWQPYICHPPPFLRNYDRDLGLWSSQPTERFLDSSGLFRARGNFGTLGLRLFATVPNYQPIREVDQAYVHSMEWIDGTLALVVANQYRTQYKRLDQLGNTLSTVEVPSNIYHLFRCESTLWAVIDERVGPFADNGTLLESFEFVLPDSTYMLSRHGCTCADGLLWTLAIRQAEQDRDGQPELYAFDLAMSLEADSAILVQRVPLPSSVGLIYQIDWNGEELIANNANRPILFIGLDGTISDSLPLPVIGSEIAWDGEAIWIVHSGLREVHSSDLLISRFYPR